MNIFVLMAGACLVAVVVARLANVHFIKELEKGKAKKILLAGTMIVVLSGIMMLYGINNLLYAVNATEAISDSDLTRFVGMRNAGAWGVPTGVFLISLGLYHLRK